MAALILYNYYRSSTSFRVRIGLEIKGLKYDYKPIHLLNGEQHNAEYRGLNPLGGVPTLVHDEKVLSQSLVILEYLDAAFPETYQLFPQQIFLRAQVKQFCENINADLHTFGNLKLLQYLEKKHGYTQSDKDKWVQHWFTDGFLALEKMLLTTSKHYCFGSTITAADLLLVPMVLTAERFQTNLEPFPIIKRISQFCLTRPEFIKAHPLRQIDTPSDQRIN